MPVTLKRASELHKGDKVLTPNMRIFTVESAVEGICEDTIDIHWQEIPDVTNLRSSYNVNLV